MKVIKNRYFDKFSLLVPLVALSTLLISGEVPAQDKQPTGKEGKSKQSTAKDQSAKPALDQESPYVIGETDRLSVTFWQQPDLNREVRVSEDGSVSLPVIGEIVAAGLTTTELSRRIIQQMSIYNTPVSQATVTVLEFNSQSVVITGEVQTPGTYRYEKMPDVWKAILDAGGPGSDADLSRVTIVRKQDGKSTVLNVDLYSIIKDGDLSKAPRIQAGDLINVPLSAFGTPLELSSTQTPIAGKNIFYIFGQVGEQGPRNLDAGMDVLDAIAVAGGFTETADLKNVRVIIKAARYSSVVKINLQEYIESGRPARMLLHPEDTIIVPSMGRGFFGSALSTVGSIAPVLGAIGTLALLVR